jgi:FlaA1/EpsC-like NDP-sugar epimerase
VLFRSIAKDINKKYGRDENNIIFIGLDKGEKLHEELITKEEIRLAVQNDNMLVIPPEKLIPYYESIGFKRII